MMKKRPGKPLLDQKTASTMKKGIIFGTLGMFIFSFLALPLWVLQVLVVVVGLGAGIYFLEKYTGLPGLLLQRLQKQKEERITMAERISNGADPKQTRLSGDPKPEQEQLTEGEWRELPPGKK